MPLKEKCESKIIFDPNHSWLETNSEKIKLYINLLEEEIGHSFRVDGILEIGSYAKEEAVPVSDIDTRIYVSSPDFYLWQTSGSRFNDSRQKEDEEKFFEFLKSNKDEKPRLKLDWFDFNEPAAKRICEKLSLNIEFGLADSRVAAHELNNLETMVSVEHQLILESNIIYDQKDCIGKIKAQIEGKIYPPMVDFYKKRYLDQLPFEIYTHLTPHKMDKFKLAKSQQIQWIKWAVRAIRDAVGAKEYSENGRFIYKKKDVLNFCSSRLKREDVDLIEELYKWKTDPEIRREIVEGFLKNPNKYFSLFKKYTEKMEEMIQRIKKL